MNFVMNHALGAGSIARPVDLQSNMLLLCYGYPHIKQQYASCVTVGARTFCLIGYPLRGTSPLWHVTTECCTGQWSGSYCACLIHALTALKVTGNYEMNGYFIKAMFLLCGYTGLGKTWADNEMNFAINHAPVVVSIAWPVDLQSSKLQTNDTKTSTY